MLSTSQFWFFCVMILSLCLCLSGQVSAHEGRPVYIELTELAEQRVRLEWKVPPVLAAGSEPTVSLDNKRCFRLPAKFQSSGLMGMADYKCAEKLDEYSDKQSLSIKIRYPKDNPALSSLLVYKPLVGESWQLFSGPSETRIVIPKRANQLDVALEYFLGGLRHILLGYDHLLFVLCLLALVSSKKQLLLTITGFTIAHSITLASASLDVFSINAALVEVLIALSIAVLAAEVCEKQRKNKSSLTSQYPVMAASTLGLLHGFGFASVLADLGLPVDLKLSALLFFNIGIETGQILFVSMMIVIIFYLRKIQLVSGAMFRLKSTSLYLMGVIGAYLALERLSLVL